MTLLNLPNNLLPKRLEKRLLKRSFVALIVIAMLGACADNKDVDPIPSGAPSSTQTEQSTDPANSVEPTKTPNAELTPPVLPEAAKENTEKGAIAFAEYFLEVLTYSANSGNTKEIKNTSSEKCVYCYELIDFIDESSEEGTKIIDFQAQFLEKPSILKKDDFAYALKVRIQHSEYVELKLNKEYINPKEIMDGTIILTFYSNMWRVHGYGPIAK